MAAVLPPTVQGTYIRCPNSFLPLLGVPRQHVLCGAGASGRGDRFVTRDASKNSARGLNERLGHARAERSAEWCSSTFGIGGGSSKSGNSWSVKSRASLGGDGDVDLYGESIAADYYSVLGLTPDATQEEIKKAYYSCMKTCHPDLGGDVSSSTEFCMFVNEVYEVLSDPEQRMIYDEINGFTLTAINPFKDTGAERDHTFVDEFTCIGCKNCAHTDPKTFEIEENFGRARVMSQCGNPARVEVAIQTCPVDCIYWVTPAQLSLLEDEMRIVERVNVGVMLSGMGYQTPDVFAQASWKWEKRQAKAIERARVRMMKEGGKKGVDAWWNAQWGGNADEEKNRAATDKYARDRAAKSAAAARRWREYSRQGVDRRATRHLPCELWSDDEEEEGEVDVQREKAGAK